MKRLVAHVCVGLALISSACVPLKKKHQSSLASDSTPVAVKPEALNSNSMWTYFAGAAQDPIYQGYIKFSLILSDKGQWSTLLWHPSQFTFHADYLTTQPEFSGLSPKQIDAISLQSNGRKVLLGTLLFPKMAPGVDLFTSLDIQLMSHDPLSADIVRSVFSAVAGQLPNAQAELFYKPVAEQIVYLNQESESFNRAGIKVSNRNSTLTRACYNTGWGVGRVRVIPNGQLNQAILDGTITSEDILVIDEVPRELPLVAGIVVSQTSSPSSHPALLAGMIGIPFVYEKDATQLDTWKQLATGNQLVYFQAKDEFGDSCQFIIRSGDALTQEEGSVLMALKKPLPLDLGTFDSSLVTPVDIAQMGRADAQKIGAKAANVAELRRIIPENSIAEALALPIGLFIQAINEAKTADGLSLRTELDTRIKALLATGVSSRDTVTRLAEVRQLIETAKLSAASQTTILQAIEQKFPKGTKVKLRSSSNIEDHPEFNGAGLYESKGACVGDDTTLEAAGLCGGTKKDPVIKTVQYVWGSLYTLKAWVARRYFGVDEAKAAMGVLVQPSFKGELANGVVISGYPAMDYSGDGSSAMELQMTGFPGEDDSVTNPPAGKVPETTRVTQDAYELQITSTEVARGRTLLEPALYRELYNVIAKVHAQYEKALAPKDKSQFKLDFEWKLINKNGAERIMIKQVRPVPMKISSTQGIDRGSMLVGEHKALLCPSPMESDDAIAKLQLSRPFEINIALQEVPLIDKATMANPIQQLSSNGQNIALSAQVAVSYTPWEKLWGTQNERREYTVSMPVMLDGVEHSLNWTGRQERSVAQTRLLLQNTDAFWLREVSLRRADKSQNYQVVTGGGKCESDAVQGFQTGSYLASTSYGKGRTAPLANAENFAPLAGGKISLNLEVRSAIQSFDKTRFKQVDKAVLKGLLAKDIVIADGFRAVYAPSHHNFQSSYAFDVAADASLTAADTADLKSRGIRFILLTLNPEMTDAAGKAVYDIAAVDDAGKPQSLGRVQRDSDF